MLSFLKKSKKKKHLFYFVTSGLPWGLSDKESACDAGDPGSVPESGRSPGGGNGSPPQCSCLETPMDGGTWKATAHGVTE